MDNKTILVDIYSRHWYNNVRWIPSPVSRESPQMGYSIGLTDILSLVQHSEIWIYDSNTKRCINLNNLQDYFSEYVPPWSRGGGGDAPQKTYVMSGTTQDWEGQQSLVSEKDVIYVYTDYSTDELGHNVPGMKVGDGKTLLSNLPFVASSSGGSGEKEVYSHTTTEWDAQPTLVSKKDTLYVYTDHKTVEGVTIPGMKFGDGVSLLKDIPFMNDSATVSDEEKAYWNSKVTVQPSSDPDDEEHLLFF